MQSIHPQHGGVLVGRTPKSTPLFATGVSKTVAFYSHSQRLLHKRIDGTKHLVQTPRAIAFDCAVLTQAQALGASSIRVTDSATGDIYMTTIEAFTALSFPVQRGHGDQRALTLDQWSINGQQPAATTRAAAQARATAEVQPMLLDVPATGGNHATYRR